MTNHVHLLASPEREISLPKTLQSVGRRYVRYFNHVYGRTGTLWEGRYKAIDRCGGLSFHLYAPYRDESGTGGDGEPTRRLPLVELPRERTGGNGGLAHPPSPVPALGQNSNRTAGGVSTAFSADAFQGRCGIDPEGDEQGVGIGQ